MTGASLPALNLYNLTKNLTAQYTYNLCAVLPMNMLTMYGAFEGETLCGVIATRSGGSHVALFFVDEKYQRQGIGKALFRRVIKECEADIITVNSSPYAVNIYRALGFTPTDIEQTSGGMRYTPMMFAK